MGKFGVHVEEWDPSGTAIIKLHSGKRPAGSCENGPIEEIPIMETIVFTFHVNFRGCTHFGGIQPCICVVILQDFRLMDLNSVLFGLVIY